MGEKLKITGVVCLYFAVSITLVFANKILMPSSAAMKAHDIDAPLFVTWFQCVLTALIIYGLGWVSQGAAADSWLREFPKGQSDHSSRSVEPVALCTDTAVRSSTSLLLLLPVDWNPKVMVSVAPLSLMFLGMISFNNLCLKFVSVPFYNVARSLTIVTNVIFTYVLLGERTSLKVCATLAIVILGFYIGVEGELDFSLIGTVFGVASSCFVSLNAIYTKKTMPLVDGDKWKLSWYNNINAALGFLPLIFLAGEHRELMNKTDVLLSSYYWFVMLIAGVLGFAIGIVTVMQINYTTPLTHNISGTVKACVQTILAILIFQAPWTWQGLSGIGLTIGGSLLYTVVRMAENDASKASAAGYSQVSKDEGVTAKLTQAVAAADEDELEAGLANTTKAINGHSGGK